MAKKFEPPEFRTPYNWDTNTSPCFDNTKDEKVTIDSMAEDADINVIMKRFGLTGLMPENPRVPNWGADYSEAPKDYRTALHRIQEADHAFMEIPADLRRRWDNDPGLWMDWIHDPQNLEEARKLGFGKALPPEIAPPPATPVAAPPPGGTKGGGTSST